MGYVPELKKFSITFMSLLLVALVLANRGVFSQFTSELSSSSTAPETLPGDPNTSPFTSSSSSSGAGGIGGSGITYGEVAEVAAIAA
jgi:hypothetical protein